MFLLIKKLGTGIGCLVGIQIIIPDCSIKDWFYYMVIWQQVLKRETGF